MNDIDPRCTELGKLMRTLQVNRYKNSLAARKREEKAMRDLLVIILGRKPTQDEIYAAFDQAQEQRDA